MIFLCLLLSCQLMPVAIHAQSVPVPTGWEIQQEADTALLQPARLKGRLFRYTVFPPQPLGQQSLTAWVQQIIRAELPGLGTTNDRINISPVAGRIYSTSLAIKTASGEDRVVSYLVQDAGNGEARMARIITEPDKNFYMPYLRTSVQHFMKLSKQNSTAATNTNTERKRASNADTKSTSAKKEKVPLASITAAPGAGLKPQEMEGIYINLEYGFGVGGYVSSEYNPYLLLKDKSIYKRVSFDPRQLDVQRSQQLEPDQWGTWSIVGKEVVVQWNNGKKSNWSNWHKTFPADAGTMLSGYYRSLGGGGNVAFGGDVMTFVQDGITFFKDGRFERGKSSGATAGGPYTTHSKTVKSSGTYTISSNRIILKDANGQVQTKAFYFFPSKGKRSVEAIGMGGEVYSKD